MGTFHINENCVEFMKECQNYYVDEKGRFSDPDDCIDSARYALLGCLNSWTEPWDNRGPRARFEAAKHNARVLQQSRRNDNRSETKRTYNPNS
jgi:hypothetical protein